MAARSIASLTLSFGLVSIPVKLYSATESAATVRFNLLSKDGSRLKQQYVSATTGKVVERADIVKGYAVSKDRYVILSDADLKAANPKATQTVDILGFVPREEIAPIYFSRPYYVSPLKGSAKAYALLREAMERSGQIGIAQIVLRTRQYVAAVYPHEAALVVHLLRYHDEIRAFKAEGLKGAGAAPRPQELAMAEQLMKTMATEWDPTEYTDTHRRDVLKLIKARARGGGKKAPAGAPEEQPETRVLDLMAALKRSVESKGKAKAPRRRASRGKSAARRSA